MEVQSLVALQIQEGRVEASLKNWSKVIYRVSTKAG